MELMNYQQAIEHLGVTDIETFNRDVKRHRCMVKRGGVVKIDVQKFETILEAEFAEATATMSTVKAKKRSVGSDLGIISARLSQDDKRRKAKLLKIAAAKEAMKAAKSAYERDKFQREVQKLENELKLQDERHTADEKRREEILNGSLDHSDNPEVVV
jgi:hypothetical protein